ncbi:hypothetical protein A4R27_03665 [Priestia endophytica]|nr:hypothetical protein A4R27_03665 [Priestia endophytica]
MKKEVPCIILYIVASLNYNIVNKVSGRYDNCGNARFNTKVGEGKYLHKCAICGLTKNFKVREPLFK